MSHLAYIGVLSVAGVKPCSVQGRSRTQPSREVQVLRPGCRPDDRWERHTSDSTKTGQDSGYGPDLYRVVERLVEQNGASTSPVVTMWQATEADPTTVHRHVYSGGAGGTEVIFYMIEGGGHTWPGRYQYASIISVGPTTQHIDGTEYIWRHLREHTLPGIEE